jgi:hypothetical protein
VQYLKNPTTATLDSGTNDERYNAAKQLWCAHSRYYAKDVLAYLDSAPSDLKNIWFHFEVEGALTPNKIVNELTNGDYLWGAWLAGLRPSSEVVPLLLEASRTKTERQRTATIFALGKSRDERVFAPLLEIMQSDKDDDAGFAAQALGDLGRLEAEAPLIAALYRKGGWLRVNACEALSKIGTRNALASLHELATSERPIGALNIRGMAKMAMEQIEAREPQ